MLSGAFFGKWVSDPMQGWLQGLVTKWCKDEKADLQVYKMYNVYSYCTAYIACHFGGEFFILGDESEEGEYAMQLFSTPLQNQPNPKSACAFQLL